jgi:hypothetical protein
MTRLRNPGIDENQSRGRSSHDLIASQASSQKISGVTNWFSTCLTDHQVCKWAFQQSLQAVLPTSLLNVDDDVLGLAMIGLVDVATASFWMLQLWENRRTNHGTLHLQRIATSYSTPDCQVL